jgi:hypothetical protein
LRLCGVNTDEINGLRSSLYGDDSLGGGGEGGVDESIETDTPIFEYAYNENGGVDEDADGVADEDGDGAENYPRREWPSHPDEVAFFDEYSAHATVEEVQNAQSTQVASQQEPLPQTMRANLASAQAARAAALGDALRRHGSPRDRAVILSHFESALRDGEVPSAAELTMRAAAERMLAASMTNDPTGPLTADPAPAVHESSEEDVDAADVIYDGELAVAIDSERVPHRQHVAVARGVLSCSPVHGPDLGAVSMFTLLNSHVTLDSKVLPPAIVLHAGLRRVQLAPLSEGDLRVWLSALTEAGAALDARAASMRDGLSPSIIGALGLSNETTIILQPPVATLPPSAGSSDCSVGPTAEPLPTSSAAPAVTTAVTAVAESAMSPVPIPVADENNPPAAVFLLVRAKTPPPPPRTPGEAITAPQLVHESSVWAPRLGALSKDGYLRLWGAAADGSISKTPSEVYFLKGSKAQTSFPLPGLPIDTAPFTVQLSREAAEQAKLPQDAASCILLACPGGRPAVLTWIAAMQSLVSGLETKVDDKIIDDAAGLGEGIDISAFPALAQKQKRPAPSPPAQSTADIDAPPAFLQAPPPVAATKSAVSEIISPTKIAPAPIPSLTGTDTSLPLLPSPWSSAATLASSLRDEVRGLAVALDALDASQVVTMCTSGGRGISANTNDAVAEAAALVRTVSDRLVAVDDLAVSLGSAPALASTDMAVTRIAAALASACETPLSASLSQSVTLLRDAATATFGVDSAVARRAQRTIHVDGLLAVSLRGTLVGLNAPQSEGSRISAAPKAVAPVDSAASSATEAAAPERALLLSKAPHAPSQAHERALLAYHMRLPEWVAENESDAVSVISRDWKAFGPRLWPLLASIHGIGAVAPYADSLSIPRSLLDINAWDAAAAACVEAKEVTSPVANVESAVKNLLGAAERTPWVRPVTVKPWQIARSEDAARVDAILAEADAVEASSGVASAVQSRLLDTPLLPVESATVSQSPRLTPSVQETFSPRGADTSSPGIPSQSTDVPAPAPASATTSTTTTTAISSPSQAVSAAKRAPRRFVAWNQSTTLEAPPNDEARVSLRRSKLSKASSCPAAEVRESIASPTLAPGSLVGTFSRRATATQSQGHSSNILRAAWNKSVLTRWSKQPGVAEKLSLINVEGRELPEEIVPAPEYKVQRVGGGALKGAPPVPPPPRRHVREPLSGARALEATAAAAAAAVPLPVVFPQAAPALAHVPTPKTRSRASSNATKQNHAVSDDEDDGTPQHVRALRAFRSNSVVAAVPKDSLQSPPPPLHPGTKIPRAAPATPQRDGSMPPVSPARSSISSTGSSIPSPSRAAPRNGTATDGSSAALAFVVSQIDTLLSPNSRAASTMSSVASAPPPPPAVEMQPVSGPSPSVWRPNLKEAASALRAEKKSKSDRLQDVLASRARAPLSAVVSPVVSPPGRSLKSLEKLSALAAQDEAVSSPRPPAPPPGPLPAQTNY